MQNLVKHGQDACTNGCTGELFMVGNTNQPMIEPSFILTLKEGQFYGNRGICDPYSLVQKLKGYFNPAQSQTTK